MDFLFQAFVGTFIVTFSFLLLTIASAGKDHFTNVDTMETVFQDEVIEEVTYEELDEEVSMETLKKRENYINVKYTNIS